MNNISVSIIIPFYNNEDWLIEAVESVFKQTFSDYEIIVINDGSKEDISIFLNKYKNKIIYHFKNNGGPASARNLGISLAHGKYLAFLDSDDIWEENKLETQFSLMEKSGSIWSHTSYSLFRDGNPSETFKLIDLSHYYGMVFPWCLASSPVLTSCVMVNAQFLRENPLLRFNENMRYGQDWFLFINIAVKEPILVISESLTRFRIRGNNAALRARVQLKARVQIWHYIKSKPEQFLGRGKVNFNMQFAYKICSVGNSFIELFEKGKIGNNKPLEFISKIIYVLPYLIFQTSHRWYLNNRSTK
jgi:teichuronic acid biosynthesis glycosyltransferase TuaG